MIPGRLVIHYELQPAATCNYFADRLDVEVSAVETYWNDFSFVVAVIGRGFSRQLGAMCVVRN